MPRLLNKREKVILYITGGIIIFSLIFNFVFLPVAGKYEISNDKIKITRAKLVKYLQLLNRKEYIQSKYNSLSSGLKVAGQKEDAFLPILSELDGLAKSSNIRIIDLRPQSQQAGNLYKENLIDLRTEGQMEGYMQFIYNIENSLSLLKIKHLQLSAKSGSAALEGNFSISQLTIPE